MELKNLESFIYVAELGSFTAAAARLGYTQSTISFQIRQLERELGTQLFERIRHTVRLTAKGRELLKLAHQMMQTASDIRRTAGEGESLQGTVRIAMADSLCTWLFCRHLADFHKRYPQISLTVVSGRTEDMFRMMNQNQVDMVYTLDGHIYDSQYVTVMEAPAAVSFIAAADSEIGKKRRVTVEDLKKEPLILTEKDISYRQLLDRQLARTSQELSPYLEVANTGLICQLVEQGAGISFLPDFVTDAAVAAGRVARLHIPQLKVDIWKQLLYHRDKWVSPEMQAVMGELAAAGQ
ncbi:MAG: LysR family transcriptional regulator [Eubacteriales bacterium]|nr:LysR family transcriptional regulator [Eubacteriales bacterium]